MNGYYRFPTIYKNLIAFISEDDLWMVDVSDLKAKRLTANIGAVSSPLFSPDGKSIAYVGREDGGTEVYIIPTHGGISKRLTYDGGFVSKIACWNDKDIIYASDLGQPFSRISDLRKVNCNGGESNALNFGISSNIAFGENFTVIGRNTQDPARWKRYKGGTAGELWIDKKNNMKYDKLINLKGNFACPMIVDSRIFFISDYEGISNIYSCNKKGGNLLKHTNHKNFYTRNATTDGKSIVYHAGSDIYLFNIKENNYKKLNIIYNSGFIDKSRKFVSPLQYLENFSLSKDGLYSNIISRGKIFTMGNWSGPALQYGEKQGVRYRYSYFLNDNKSLFVSSDEGGEECFQLHSIANSKKIKNLKSNVGRPIDIKQSPISDSFTIENHKHELFLLDIKKDTLIKIDHSKYCGMSHNWSPDGNFIAYSISKTSRVAIIKIYDIKNKKSFEITDAINDDFSPVFDDTGKYLAFISKRTFNPVYDSIQFDLNFTKSEKPYIVALNKDIESPFIKNPEIKSKSDDSKSKKNKKDKKLKMKIDFKHIKDRIMEVPISESKLDESIGFYNNKIYYIEWPVSGSRQDGWYDMNELPKGILKYYDLDELKENVFMQNVSSFNIDYRNKNIIINSGKNIRVLTLSSPPNKEMLSKETYDKKTGLINFDRIKLNIDINQEWHQMYREAWRLQRDYFWDPKMSNIDWNKIYKRYLPLINRAGTRSEFSDLVWEMQGELGTSHCYEFGGDYKYTRQYNIGLLGAKLKFDSKRKMYKIISISKGDVWDKNQSPLYRPGVNINQGDYISKINNTSLDKKTSPNEHLVNHANKEIQLTVVGKNNKKTRNISIKTLRSTQHLHYRDWVERNREYVHKKSNGKIGYLHIPDMGADGYAEFHRYFLAEIIHDGLIVDVRFNGGGHVSQLLLSKLAKKRIGYDLTRWMGVEPYPSESPAGPMVAITNEYAGSDGDIFSHSWKLMKLGKLIGKRTWGGVIGIWPRNSLVDGTVTSQPEFSFWFKDVGWNVENYGTDVDIEVHIKPEDFQKNIDTQLDKAISLVKNDLKEKNAILKADLSKKPNLKLPN